MALPKKKARTMPDIDDMTLELILRREANKGTGAAVQLRAMFLTHSTLWQPTGRITDTPTIAEFMKNRTMLNERPAPLGLVDAGYGPSGVSVWRNTNTMKMTGVMRGSSLWLAIAMKAADGTFRVLWAGASQSVMFDAWAETKIPSGALELVLSADPATPAAPLGDEILTDATPKHVSDHTDHVHVALPGDGGATDKSIIEAINAAKEAIRESSGDVTFEVYTGSEWLHVTTVSSHSMIADDAPRLRNQITLLAKEALKNAHSYGRLPPLAEEKTRDTRIVNVVRTSGHTGTDAVYGFDIYPSTGPTIRMTDI